MTPNRLIGSLAILMLSAYIHGCQMQKDESAESNDLISVVTESFVQYLNSAKINMSPDTFVKFTPFIPENIPDQYSTKESGASYLCPGNVFNPYIIFEYEKGLGFTEFKSPKSFDPPTNGGMSDPDGKWKDPAPLNLVATTPKGRQIWRDRSNGNRVFVKIDDTLINIDHDMQVGVPAGYDMVLNQSSKTTLVTIVDSLRAVKPSEVSKAYHLADRKAPQTLR